ncbi:MAG: hypothetical protein EHM35_00495 [Planctomycetaceae bacterium]|nr:MAG: hypothetical protein EHM35_00495 [Planctomycetaceae bacterium]
MYRRIENAILVAKDERADGFDARVELSDKKIVIETRISRDPSRARNGGEYNFWQELWPDASGGALMQEFCSCDFWQPEGEPEVLGLTFKEAEELVRTLAAERGVPIN